MSEGLWKTRARWGIAGLLIGVIVVCSGALWVFSDWSAQATNQTSDLTTRLNACESRIEAMLGSSESKPEDNRLSATGNALVAAQTALEASNFGTAGEHVRHAGRLVEQMRASGEPAPQTPEADPQSEDP